MTELGDRDTGPGPAASRLSSGPHLNSCVSSTNTRFPKACVNPSDFYWKKLVRMEQSPRGIWPWLFLAAAAGSAGVPWGRGLCTFSALLREVSGFTRMDGGADAGGFGAASPFTEGSLVSRITELHTEGLRLSPPLTSSAGEAS